MEYRKILAAIDRANPGTEVFEDALALARKQEAELMLFFCQEQETAAELEHRVGAFTEMDQSEAQKALEHLEGENAAHTRAWLESLQAFAQEEGVTAHATIDVGSPGKRICAVAAHWGADLIMLGQSHRGRLAQCLLGSVSSHVAHHAPCSVLLINRRHN
jgi:nucleotide-binding universal stress UspA family protein